ncbi:MAG: DUF202 domain-containing protein [Isosphaeraceae bacterium]
MTNDGSDPRVYFAAERTLLAWVRTGLTVMGLGFVVARFGLFLQVLRRDATPQSSIGSTLIGVGLVVLGSSAVAIAARQHVRFCRGMPAGSRPQPDPMATSVGLAIALAAVGLVLAGYMLWRSSPA